MKGEVLHPGYSDPGWDDGLWVEGFGVRFRPAADGRWSPFRPQAPLVCIDGVVYAGDRATGVLRAGERLIAGADGSWACGGDLLRAGAPPRGHQRPIGAPIVTRTARISAGRAFGLGPDGEGRWFDLRTGDRGDVDGWPLADGVVVRDDGVWSAGERVRDDLRAASCALAGTRLAGPGGRVWDLRAGRPVSGVGVVRFGATCALAGGGFATIDWTDHRGWRLTEDGEPYRPFAVAVDDDDVVSRLAEHDGRLLAFTAAGCCIDVDDGQRSDAQPPRARSTLVPTPWGPLPGGSTADVDGRRYAWDDDGWLLTWPVSIS